MSLAQRSTTSAVWNAGASVAQAAVLFVRSVLLARLLPVETFGVYAFATAVVTTSVILPNFGMGGAFVHRATETEDESQAAAVYFTLKLLFTALWAVVLSAAAVLLTSGPTRTALLWLTLAMAGLQMAQTPRLILMRRVRQQRLAALQLVDALLTTAVALLLAWQGFTLWALLATDFISMAIALVGLYGWRPVWRPHLSLATDIRRYFLAFGRRNVLAELLLRALDEVDDLYAGLFLGPIALGYYSRAYAFATYPRRLLAAPINSVAGGTYAELKGQRVRLSRAFVRVNLILVRAGFYFAGLLVLIAPEFIRLLLGARWLPMLTPFRLMLIFTLLDPLRLTVSNVFLAVGEPQRLVRVRLVQMAVLLFSLFTLGAQWGINGVALAVNGMLLVGLSLLLWQARRFVDFSLWRLFAVPLLALGTGTMLAVGGTLFLGSGASDWLTAAAKGGLFTLLYVVVLLLWERDELRSSWTLLRQTWRKDSP